MIDECEYLNFLSCLRLKIQYMTHYTYTRRTTCVLQHEQISVLSIDRNDAIPVYGIIQRHNDIVMLWDNLFYSAQSTMALIRLRGCTVRSKPWLSGWCFCELWGFRERGWGPSAFPKSSESTEASSGYQDTGIRTVAQWLLSSLVEELRREIFLRRNSFIEVSFPSTGNLLDSKKVFVTDSTP